MRRFFVTVDWKRSGGGSVSGGHRGPPLQRLWDVGGNRFAQDGRPGPYGGVVTELRRAGALLPPFFVGGNFGFDGRFVNRPYGECLPRAKSPTARQLQVRAGIEAVPCGKISAKFGFFSFSCAVLLPGGAAPHRGHSGRAFCHRRRAGNRRCRRQGRRRLRALRRDR